MSAVDSRFRFTIWIIKVHIYIYIYMNLRFMFISSAIHTNQGFNTHINAPAVIRNRALSLIINQSQQMQKFFILNFYMIYNNVKLTYKYKYNTYVQCHVGSPWPRFQALMFSFSLPDPHSVGTLGLWSTGGNNSSDVMTSVVQISSQNF